MTKWTAILLVFAAFPAAAQQPLTPLQQYLYNESGYLPPSPAPPPVTSYPYATAYAPVSVYPAQPVATPPVSRQAPDYEADYSTISGGGDAGLRAMLTSAGN